MRSCGAVLDAGGHKCTQNNEHTMASTRAHGRHRESETLSTSLRAKEEMQRGDKAEKMSRRWAR